MLLTNAAIATTSQEKRRRTIVHEQHLEGRADEVERAPEIDRPLDPRAVGRVAARVGGAARRGARVSDGRGQTREREEGRADAAQLTIGRRRRR